MIRFPDVAEAAPSGLLCISEDMPLELLWSAYRQGIFPWTDSPVGWFAPPERAVIDPKRTTFPRNVRKLWRKAGYEVSLDTQFDRVIAACRDAHAHEGEWITPRFVRAYQALHRAGYAHSVELYSQGQLVGGTYGVLVGRTFSAESMFGHVDNASRSALYALCCLAPSLHIDLIDVQVRSDVTQRLGAYTLPRAAFMQTLIDGCAGESRTVSPAVWPREPFEELSGEAPQLPFLTDAPASSR